MFVIAGAVIGALWGGLLARRRKGDRFDIAQYAAVFALVLALLGLFVTVFVERSM